MKQTLLTMLACVIATGTCAAAADTLEPVSTRYASAETREKPDFRRHVVPLLGKLGCNGRACHGSFQGRGGFRLSLFGYDFKADHEALLERLDTDAADESLIIEKPTTTVPHEGGRRFAKGSWQHHLIRRWVESGAAPVPADSPELLRVDVTPQEILFDRDGETRQLKVVAVWADGTEEDVTPLCRFSTNDDQVCDVGARGEVTAGAAGDTHVVISYDRAVVPIPVIRPVSPQNRENYPAVATRTEIDRLVVRKLSKLGILPSDVCTDSEFLRRVSLDLTGTLPTSAEVQAFLDDPSSDKRSRKIDELLQRPGYVGWWTTKLCDFTGNSDDALNNVTPIPTRASQDWYDWIAKRVRENTPYDKIVEGIVVARSREDGESYEEYSRTMSQMYAQGSKLNFADRSSMPHYWARRTFRQPEERAIGFAYTFLGTRIQCAQCHKHPFDQWTQDDFKQFQNLFTRAQFGRSPDAKQDYDRMMAELDTGKLKGGELRRRMAELLREGKTVPFQEVYSLPPQRRPQTPDFSRIKDPAARKRAEERFKAQAKRRRNNNRPATGKLLGGDVLDLNEYTDPREPLMEWLRAEPNFAKAFVNRVWASYFNRGIVDPPDNLSLANPPVNAELLDYLAQGFVDHGFDMKWLHREITNSDTYQRSWRPNETNRLDERNFSRAVPRRLPAEVAVDAIAQATSGDQRAQAMTTTLTGRAIAIPGAGRRVRTNRDAAYALTIFGRSVRESNCDCDRSMEPSLLQTVFLMNDDRTLAMIDGRGSWLEQIAKAAGVPFTPKAQAGGQGSNANRRQRQLRQQMTQLQNQIRKLSKQQGKEKQVAKLRRQLNQLRQRVAGNANPASQADDTGQGPATTSVDPQVIVRDAYLRTLSRLPTDDETQVALGHLRQASDIVSGSRDLLWALLNTKEFIVNH